MISLFSILFNFELVDAIFKLVVSLHSVKVLLFTSIIFNLTTYDKIRTYNDTVNLCSLFRNTFEINIRLRSNVT